MNAPASLSRADAGDPPVFDPMDTESIARRLAAFVEARIGGRFEVGPLKRFTVGFSWVTYGFQGRFRENGREVRRDMILRVGPPNGIFAPYKASPEFLALKSLAGGGTPVPAVYWHSDASDALGAPFLVCEKVLGDAPIPWTHDGGPAFPEPMRMRIGDQFLSALTALHNFDWHGTPAAGIGGRRDIAGAAADTVEAWEAGMRHWSDRQFPMLDHATRWLKRNAPATARISIVHGDFRIGNFLLLDGRITAMLDWELVSLGDPLEDLGWICLQAWRGRTPYMCHLFTREELRERYEAATGIPVDARALAYWEAFGTYKLAVMHLAATHCFERGRFNDLRMAGMGAQIPRMLLQLESAMERAG